MSDLGEKLWEEFRPLISFENSLQLTWCCKDDPRTALVRCSMAFQPLSKLYSCSRGSLKCQSLQFSHGPVNEWGKCFAISGLDGGSGSGGHTALPILFGQIDEQPEEEMLLSTTYIHPLTSSSSRCWPDLALESTRSKSVPPAAYSIAITWNMQRAHNMACSTHHSFVLQEVFIILNHIGMVEHGQHFDLVENALTIRSGHHVHWNLFQDHLQRTINHM